MQLLWRYLRNYKKLLAFALVLGTINQVFSLLDPQIFQRIVDNYATKAAQLSSGQFIRGVGLLLLGTIGVAFVSRVAKSFQDYYVNVITQRLGTRMYSDSVSHSFSLPYAVFEDQRSGEFLQKLQQARNDAQLLIQQMINILFVSLVGILFVLGYAFYVHWAIGLVYTLMIPVLGTTTFYISKGIKRAQDTIVKQTQELAGSTTETIRNVELVKSLGLEHQEISRLNNTNEQILELELKKVKLVRSLSFIQGTAINALRSSLMLLMLWLIFKHDITLGQFFTLLFYSFFLFQPLGELGNVAAKYYETQASMDRLGEILQTAPEQKPTNPTPVDKITEIKFDNVSFTYGSAHRPAAADINLSIKAGQTVAFAGPSGSGKTTLTKLLVGLYKPNEGKLFFNDIDTGTIDWEAFRTRVGLVSQDTQLFAGSIRENLLFAAPTATDEDCMKALEQSAATKLIERGTNGLDTLIGEGGLKLSGGEKQRLAIARALLRNPELIIFDEATSSLDSLTEEEITNTIKAIVKSRPDLITVLVAHRLSTIVHSDKIFVLEKGKIAESGNHQELLNQKGLYAALWRQQIASDVV